MTRLTNNQYLVDEVLTKMSRRLKRNLYAKEGRGAQRHVFYISDPVFPSLQRDSKTKDRGRFSCGFYLDLREKIALVGFCNVHIRSPLLRICENSENGLLLTETLQRIQRERYSFAWSSQTTKTKTKHKAHLATLSYEEEGSLLENLRTYLGCSKDELAQSLLDDLAPNMPNTYKNTTLNTKGPMRGTDLRILMEVNSRSASIIVKKLQLVEDIFLALYPTSVDSYRRSGYREKLLRHYSKNSIKIICAHKRCDITELAQLQAAHLTPVRRGGSDQTENLVFLCRQHHRKQENRSLREQRRMLKKESRMHTKIRD